MSGQDWNIVVLRKDKTAAMRKTGPRGFDPAIKVERTVDSDEKPMDHKTYDNEFAKKVMNYRVTNEITQKQLANMISCKEDIIRNLENGKGIYNPTIVTKLKRIIGE